MFFLIEFVFLFSNLGYYHGDIKPSNLVLYKYNYLGNMKLKVIDLGGSGNDYKSIKAYTPGFLNKSQHFKQN
jgi:hypothetical protein